MTRPYGTPLDCTAVGWDHHWLPISDKGPRFVGQVCATCDMIRLPQTPEARLMLLADNVAFMARSRALDDVAPAGQSSPGPTGESRY